MHPLNHYAAYVYGLCCTSKRGKSIFDQSILARYCLPSLRSYQDDKFRNRHGDVKLVGIWDSPWFLGILEDLETSLEDLEVEQLCDGDEKTLDDLDREYRMERLERLFKWYIRFLEKLFRALMFICVFSVFPNERRPPCKTMPWDILPSLAVLWGVCWMFYTPTNGTQAEEDYRIGVNNAFLNFPHASLAESPGHQFPFSTYDSDQNWDWSNVDFGYMTDRLQPWAIPAEVNPLQSTFEPISSFGIDAGLGVFTVPSTDSDGGKTLAGHGIASAMPRNEFSTENNRATGQFDTADRQHAPPPAPSRRQSASGEPGQKTHRSHLLQDEALSSNDTYYYCPEPSCDRSNKPFARKDNRDDHIKRKHVNYFDRDSQSMPSNSMHQENDNQVSDLDFTQQMGPEIAQRPATGKRKRVETHEASAASSTTACEDCGSVQAEISTLKRRVIELEDKLRSSKEKAETLSEVIRGGWNRGN
ncbi:hypothetical protein SNOG_15317 [Parastagonospora nodorum SN15]|uniref:Uncharacterized protein n=1 Tax=Phaeosphaeria nodorum (strain SN15 / ATCC MYA-4574 / FGSC 10173) TaxID=321614 RepID=Q0TYP0_PHANO|nr:hypothetical protein SNOG_15317 [Parastagonospora nodorum SN15]EAT77250.1 hypothetical protein SNOG_15317 [Parastagonospora nodorum SN15]